MHEAAGAPPQLTDGACAAAQSTGAAALRRILQARPLALRVHRERAIVDKSTDLWAADLHVGRALRKDNRGPRMLARTRTRRASGRPGGGRPSSPPERPCACPGVANERGLFPSVRNANVFAGMVQSVTPALFSLPLRRRRALGHHRRNSGRDPALEGATGPGAARTHKANTHPSPAQWIHRRSRLGSRRAPRS